MCVCVCRWVAGGGQASLSFPVCFPACVCVQSGEKMHRMCVTNTMCVSFVCGWENALLIRCKAMPHRDGLQGHIKRLGGRELCPVAWIEDHFKHVAHFCTALLRAIRWVKDREER